MSRALARETRAQAVRRNSRILGALLLCILLLVGCYQYFVVLPQSESVATAFAVELAGIGPPDSLRLVGQDHYAKPGQSVAFRKYNGTIGVGPAGDYFGAVLTGSGWVFVRDIPRSGMFERCWQRNDDTATLDVAGDPDLGGTSYLLTLSRGLSGCS